MVVQVGRGDDDVTLGEVYRIVVETRKVMQDFVTEVRADYVRKDVNDERWQLADAQRVAVETRVRALEDENDKRLDRADSTRRLVYTALFTAVLAPVLVAIIVAQVLHS